MLTYILIDILICLIEKYLIIKLKLIYNYFALSMSNKPIPINVTPLWWNLNNTKNKSEIFFSSHIDSFITILLNIMKKK